MDGLLAGLNAAQRSAVASDADVLQVLAPPGSGKTKTLTARVSHLITCRQYKPWNILVCTFTVKAAREMKERITSVVGVELAKKLILGTFHSVARRFLSTYGHYIGLDKQFGIADTSDTKAIIKRVIKDHDLSVEPAKAQARISSNKAKKISAEQYAVTARRNKIEDQEFLIVYSHYQAALELSNLLDYDDLLLKCEELLRLHPQCVANIEAVLIDEFQDTNEVQFDLMCQFAQRNRRITIVGDPDQSIYGWRNAEIENLNKMKRVFPDTLVIFLEENYRSTGAILSSAQTVIEQDKARPDKRLQATHGYGERPVLRRLPTADAEARWLVAEIKRAQAMTGGMLTLDDFAVLLRSAQLSRHIETALGNNGIPYRMVGGTKFYDRAEIKILLDYMRVINRPEHNDAVLRVLNVPARNIGDITAKKLLDEATEKQSPLWDLLRKHAQGRAEAKTKIAAQAEKGIVDFVNVVLSGRSKMTDANATSATPAYVLEYLVKRLDYGKFLKKKYPEDHENRWANVEELQVQAADASTSISMNDDAEDDEALPDVDGAVQATIPATESMLTTFLSNIALSSATEQKGANEEAEQHKVTISTIHAAKGLEWPVVFIPSCYEGSIPHSRAEDTDEERRLLYVGMTRAQAMLYLSLPMRNGQSADTALSSFLDHGGVTAGLSCRGPEIELPHVRRLAVTLGRECPSLAEIEGTRSKTEAWDDTYWPEDGTWPVEESSRWDRGIVGRQDGRGGKVTPAELAGFGSAKGFMSAAKITIQSVNGPNTVSSVTPATGGFFSAASRLAEADVRADEANRRWMDRRSARETSAPSASGAGSKAPKRAVSENKHGGDIGAFFGRPKMARLDLDSATTGYNGARQDSTPLQRMVPTAVNERAGSQKMYADGFSAIQARTEEPLSPQKSHRLPSTSALKRPAPVSAVAGTVWAVNRPDADRYIFLSSSPPPSEHNSDIDGGLSENRPAGGSKSNSALSADGEALQPIRPASTLHTTSVDTLRRTGVSATGVKRSLGMKGPMKPWSARNSR